MRGRAGLLVLTVAVGAAGQEAELVPVPTPDLETLEASGRQRLTALQETIEELRQDPEARGELAAAYGRLGQYALASEWLESAEAAFRNASSLAPYAPRWSYYLGVVLETRGALQAALEAFRRVVEVEPRSVASLVRMGNVLLELDRAQEAREPFQAVLELDPDSAAALYGLGKIAALEGDYQEAVERFEGVLKLQPEASVVHYPLAQAYRRLGDMAKAREHLLERGDAEVLYPDPFAAEIGSLALGGAYETVLDLAAADDFDEEGFLGFALAQLGDVEGVVEQLRATLRSPQEKIGSRAARARGRLRYLLGALLIRKGQEEAAREELLRALDLAPDLLDARVKLGNLEARAGNLERAVELYSEALGGDAIDSSVRLRRAAALMELGRLEEAAPDLEQLAAESPESGEVWHRLGVVREVLGDVDGAAEALEKALSHDLPAAQQGAVLLALGNVAVARGRLETALERYTRAVDAVPTLHEARFQKATTLGRLGRYAEAAAAYRELLELDPTNERGWLGEATSLTLSGREAEAVERLEAALEALPRSLALTHALARLLASAKDPALRDGERAVELATAAVQAASTLDHAETLAMALAEAGRFEDAAALQERLVETAAERGDEAVRHRLEARLALYRAGRPCCG